jgi:hypothetical protein
MGKLFCSADRSTRAAYIHNYQEYLLYSKALYETAQWLKAKTHLEQDAKYWGHSESWLLLAKIALQQESDSLQDSSASRAAARSYLNTMITKLKAAPKYHYRRNQHLVREAKKMLKTLK